MVYCQNDQHWPWFIATVINRTLSEFFSKNKTDLRTLITCVRSLDLFYLITEREKKSVVFFIRFSSFTFVYIFTSTRKRSQLFFVRLRSFTFPPSPLLPSQSLFSPLLPSTLGLKQVLSLTFLLYCKIHKILELAKRLWRRAKILREAFWVLLSLRKNGSPLNKRHNQIFFISARSNDYAPVMTISPKLRKV